MTGEGGAEMTKQKRLRAFLRLLCPTYVCAAALLFGGCGVFDRIRDSLRNTTFDTDTVFESKYSRLTFKPDGTVEGSVKNRKINAPATYTVSGNFVTGHILDSSEGVPRDIYSFTIKDDRLYLYYARIATGLADTLDRK